MQIDLNSPVEMSRYSLPQSEAEPCLFTLRNVSGHIIASVELLLSCYDKAGHELVHQQVTLNDLQVKPREQFEAKIYTVEWPDVEQVNLIVQKASFTNGETWRIENAELHYYEPNDLPNGSDLDRLRFIAGEDAVGYPAKMGNVWICVCGRPNLTGKEYCARCGRSAIEEFICFTHEAVEQSIAEKEAQLNEQSRKAIQDNNELQYKRERAYSARRRKIKEAVRWISISLAVACIAAFVYFFGLPEFKYRKAMDDLQANNFDSAYSGFVSLHDYRDSAQQADICLREKADFAYAKQTVEGYEEAEQIYAFLGDRQNGSEMVPQCQYALADLYTQQGAYERAAEIYQQLEDYKDSEQRLNQVILNQASVMMEGKSYSSARVLLAGLPQTDEVKQKISQCAYEIGLGYMNETNWTDALTELEPLGDYLDAADLCAKANYEIAQEMRLREDYDSAIAYYTLAGDYMDAPAQIRFCANTSGKAAMKEGDWERALACFEQAGDDSESKSLADTCLCNLALEHISAGDREAAMTVLASVSNENKSEEVLQVENECYYELAIEAIKAEDYQAAEELLEEIDNYKDSDKQLRTVRYALALQDMESGEYERALQGFENVGDYKKSLTNAKICRYQLGIAAMEKEEYEKAAALFSELGRYKDSAAYLNEAKILLAEEQMKEGRNEDAEELLSNIKTEEAAEMLETIRLKEGAALEAEGRMDEALALYQTLTDCEEALARIRKIYYQKALQYEKDENWLMAGESYFDAGNYEDAMERCNYCFEKLYGSAPKTAREAASLGNSELVVNTLSDLPLTEKCYNETDLPLLLKQAQLNYADELYRTGKPYDAMPYYQILGNWEDTFEKKLNRRTYLILGEWESNAGVEMVFRTDGTCKINGRDYFFRVNNFSLFTGETPETMTQTHRLNTISQKEMSLSDTQGKRAVDYHFVRIGEWILADAEAANSDAKQDATVEVTIVETKDRGAEESFEAEPDEKQD